MTSTSTAPTVAIVGAGAMGAMYADHTSRATLRALLVAHGQRADRLRKQPITVNGQPLAADVVDPLTDEDPPNADLIIVAVKHAQLSEAAELIAPLVTARTTILSVLNGLDSEAIIRAELGQRGVAVTEDQVPLCIALAMDAERVGGEVRYTQAGRLVLGSADGQANPHLERAQDLLNRAGLAWDTPTDMTHQMWWKFMVNVGINQASAVLRSPYGAFVEPGPAHDLMWALIEEVRQVARAEGVGLTDADADRWRAVLAGQPADGMTSMHQDVLAGRQTEVDIFAGRVVELGAEHGIPVPHNQTLLWILTALETLPTPSSPGSPI